VISTSWAPEVNGSVCGRARAGKERKGKENGSCFSVDARIYGCEHGSRGLRRHVNKHTQNGNECPETPLPSPRTDVQCRIDLDRVHDDGKERSVGVVGGHDIRSPLGVHDAVMGQGTHLGREIGRASEEKKKWCTRVRQARERERERKRAKKKRRRR
jgi:hypothetical protein